MVLSEHRDGGGAAMFRHACRMVIEGIVSKRRGPAIPIGRSPDWIKVKNPDVAARAD